jgi:predicted pyridoxine 5'-phosphate oxidase superfamily flavin-nucleotide-binding protein
MLTPDVLKYMDSSVLCWIATVDLKGAPNVSPKEIFVSHGTETVLIANIASPTTIRNIQVSPNVCLSFVDVFIQKGYKLLGTARVVAPKDSEFAGFVAPLEKLTKGQFPIHSAICVRVEKVEPIVAPSYRLKSGTTESSQVQSALKTYGVNRNDIRT